MTRLPASMISGVLLGKIYDTQALKYPYGKHFNAKVHHIGVPGPSGLGYGTWPQFYGLLHLVLKVCAPLESPWVVETYSRN